MLKQKFAKLKNWMVDNVDKPKVQWSLFGLSFSEASFFLIPPDVFLIPVVLSNKKKWLYYGVFTTLASVLGACFGYLIGLFFYDLLGQPIIDFYHLEAEVAKVGELFRDNAFWALFLSAFTPIPFKVFTITGGFFRVNVMLFVLASTVGRGLRFILVAYLANRYGKYAIDVAYRYFNYITALIALIVIAILILL